MDSPAPGQVLVWERVDGPAPAPSAQPPQEPTGVDLDALERETGALLECYRQVMQAAAGLPLLHRVREKPQRPSPPAWVDRLWGRHRWVAGPLARHLVARHIRDRLEGIMRVLRVEAMSLPAPPAPGQPPQRLRSTLARVEHAHDSLFGKRLHSGAVRAGLPVLTVFGASAATVVSNGETSNILTALTRKVTEWLAWDSTAGFSGAAGFLADLSLLLLLVLAVASPFVVRLGFWAKRALLRGGGTAVRDVWRKERPVHGLRVPEANSYAAEARLFQVLGARRPREVPLDGFLSFWALSVLAFLALGVTFTLQDFQEDPNTLGPSLGAVGLVLAVYLALAWPGIAAVRRRRKQGHW